MTSFLSKEPIKIIISDGSSSETLFCHKEKLVEISDYFKAMFVNFDKECSEITVVSPDVCLDVFLLNCLYEKNFDIVEYNFEERISIYFRLLFFQAKNIKNLFNKLFEKVSVKDCLFLLENYEFMEHKKPFDAILEKYVRLYFLLFEDSFSVLAKVKNLNFNIYEGIVENFANKKPLFLKTEKDIEIFYEKMGYKNLKYESRKANAVEISKYEHLKIDNLFVASIDTRVLYQILVNYGDEKLCRHLDFSEVPLNYLFSLAKGSNNLHLCKKLIAEIEKHYNLNSDPLNKNKSFDPNNCKTQ